MMTPKSVLLLGHFSIGVIVKLLLADMLLALLRRAQIWQCSLFHWLALHILPALS